MHIISEEQQHSSVACKPPDALSARNNNTLPLLANHLMHIISKEQQHSSVA
jgi:hypothetical protein